VKKGIVKKCKRAGRRIVSPFELNIPIIEDFKLKCPRLLPFDLLSRIITPIQIQGGFSATIK
jgi:hypothetical protein